MRRGWAGSVCRPIRDWVLAFNADGPDGLIDGKAPGNAPKLNDAQRRALVAIVESGPIPAIHGVVRWRLRDLAWWVFEEFGISLGRDDGWPRTAQPHLPQAVGPARSIMRRTRGAWRLLKKSSDQAGCDPGAAPGWHRHRAVVAEPALGLDPQLEHIIADTPRPHH